MFSLLDDFLGYNQVLVAEPDWLIMTFCTKWDMFDFHTMPFWLMNIGETFQRAMDITFHRLIIQSVVFYLDDVTISSRQRSNHLCHLKKNFERCRKYGISLNPKKRIFAVSKGNLLGHIISKSGIKVDPDRVQSITQIPHPMNKKSM